MLRLATDVDVRGELIRGLRRRVPHLDLVRSQDALPENAPDRVVLAWAAAEDRVLITNDRSTMIRFACERVAGGEPMAGLIITTNQQSIGSTLDDLEEILHSVSAQEARDRVLIFLPLPDSRPA